MEEPYYIGIDIGKKGGICISGNGRFSRSKMPLTKNGDVDFIEIFERLRFFQGKEAYVCFEELRGIYGASKESTWELAEQCGKLKFIVKLLKIPYIEVQPKKWQKEIFEGIGKKTLDKDSSDYLKMNSTTDTKTMAYFAFLRLYPNLEVPKGSRGGILDGVIDAVLLMRYCARVVQFEKSKKKK